MSKRLYFRCNGGHYFQGLSCKWDGWSIDGTRTVWQRACELQSNGVELDIELIKEMGVEPEIIRRVILMEFGDDNSAFEALAPERYISHGKDLSFDNIGLDLL